MKKNLKIALISLAGLFVAAFALFTFYTNKSLDESMGAMKPENCPASPYFVSGKIHGSPQRMQAEEEAFPRLKEISQVVSIKTFDGLNLNAYFSRNPSSHDYLIFMHGYTDSPKDASSYAMHFADMGWNVLVPGQRGHGWSDGKFIDMGAFACRDTVEWAKFIVSQDPDAKILLYGVSMGCATVTMATGLDLPLNVRGCVADCGFSSIYKQFAVRLGDFHVPEFPGMFFARNLVRIKIGYDMKKCSSVEAVKKSVTPTLFIHGDADTYVPFSMLEEIYTAAQCPKEKLVVSHAGHAESAFTEPELYWSTVDSFVGRYFNAE